VFYFCWSLLKGDGPSAALLPWSLGIGMIIAGMPRYGIERSFVRSWPLFISYVMISMILIVFGAAWIISGVFNTAGPH
jgi:hypothetical protein